MKNKLILLYKKLKIFMFKKRQFPVHLHLLPKKRKAISDLYISINSLKMQNKLLRDEIKKLKFKVELAEMDAALERENY